MQASLLKGDRTIQQNYDLHFESPVLERMFQRDNQHTQKLSFYMCQALALLSYLFSHCYIHFCFTVIIGFAWRSRPATLVLLQVMMIIGEVLPAFEMIGLQLFPFALHFFAIKSWRIFGLNTAAALILNSGGLPAGLFYLSVYFILEKDFRDLWLVQYSFKKWYKIFYRMFLDATQPFFLVDRNGYVQSFNRAATRIFDPQVRDFSDNLPENKDAFMNQIRKACEGVTSEEEYALVPPEDLLELKVHEKVGVKVRASPYSDGVLLECNDNSRAMLSRSLLLSFLSKINQQCDRFTHGFIEQCYRMPDRAVISEYFKIDHSLRALYFTQAKLLSVAKVSDDCIDICAECQNIFDVLYSSASMNGIKLTIKREPNIPQSVKTNKDVHNQLVYSLTQWSIHNCKSEREVNLFIQMPHSRNVMITYMFIFVSESLVPADLDEMFKHPERKSLTELVKIFGKYPSDSYLIPTYLELLNGYVLDVYMNEEYRKVHILVNLPFERGSGLPVRNLTNIHQLANIETVMSVKWQSNNIDLLDSKSPAEPSNFEVIQTDGNILISPISPNVLDRRRLGAANLVDKKETFSLRSASVQSVNTLSSKCLVLDHSRDIFIKMQASADIANSANEVLRMYQEYLDLGHIYKVIFLECNAIDAAVQIREMEAKLGHKRTQICGVSNSLEDREKCLDVGMDCFLKIPVKREDIFNLVNS